MHELVTTAIEDLGILDGACKNECKETDNGAESLRYSTKRLDPLFLVEGTIQSTTRNKNRVWQKEGYRSVTGKKKQGKSSISSQKAPQTSR